jgi:hypothetical protein
VIKNASGTLSQNQTKEITYPQVLPEEGHTSPYGGVPPHPKAAPLLAVGPLKEAMGLHRATEVSLPLPEH